LSVFAYGPSTLGLLGLGVGSAWYVGQLLASPFSLATVGPYTAVFLAVLVAGLATSLVGALLLGGTQS